MIIFSPGPANISRGVRKSLLSPDICHRSNEFSEILRETKSLILKVCGVNKSYEAVIFTGSGTAAIEASIASLRSISKKMLVISNGAYGERAFEIARIFGLKVRKAVFPNHLKPDLSAIEEEIRIYKPQALYIVHHETTTGLLNPLEEIAKLAKKYNLLFMVDAISSIAGEEIKLKNWGIDVLIGSANKCIRSVSGLSFVVLSPRYVLKMGKKEFKNTYYLDLYEYLTRERLDETPFTPAVHNFYAFRQALRELVVEGVQVRIKHYINISRILRQGLRKRGFYIYVDDRIASNTMTTVLLPPGMTYEALFNGCKKFGFVIYGALGKLSAAAFRLGVVGCITPNDCKRFLCVLDKVMIKKGRG